MKLSFHLLAALLLTLGDLVATLHAGPRTSANYSILTDTADSGGRRSTSANYTNDASVGGITGVSTVAAPAATAKAGYIAQLYEVTGLTLTSALPNVNEGTTLQLGAWLALDDSTLLAIPAPSVAWSAVSGPLTGLSAAGLAAASTVYQDTVAIVQGMYLGQTGTLPLTVTNVTSDNFGSYAGDGLDDAWQHQHFGLNNPQAAPGADPDGDGETNSDEFSAMTDPANAASVFRITSAGRSGGDLVISFPTVTGRTYTLWRSDTLAEGSWTNTGLPALAGTGATLIFTVPATTPAHRFFRVHADP